MQSDHQNFMIRILWSARMRIESKGGISLWLRERVIDILLSVRSRYS